MFFILEYLYMKFAIGIVVRIKVYIFFTDGGGGGGGLTQIIVQSA